MGLSVKQRELGGAHLCEGEYSVCVCACVSDATECVRLWNLSTVSLLFLEWTIAEWRDETGGDEQISAVQTDLYKERPTAADFSMD